MSRAYIAKSKKVDWGTPEGLFDALDRELGPFDLDVAAGDDLHVCDRYYTEALDGLTLPWEGRVWCNPPYGRGIGRWLQRGRLAAAEGEAAIVVFLVPAYTSPGWWHDHVLDAERNGEAEIRYLRGRLKFKGAKTGAPFASAVVIYRGKPRPSRQLELPVEAHDQ